MSNGLEPPTTSTLDAEIEFRFQLWAALNHEYQANVPPSVLKERRIYRGQRGIYADAERTRPLTGKTAITIGLVHTGTSYPDDLSEDEMVYHYPRTDLPSRDASEVASTKTAALLGVPLFAVTPGEMGTRRVHLGWVEGWDDKTETFLVSFGEAPATTPAIDEQEDEDEFDLFTEISRNKREVADRPGQQRFKFQVFQRYGSKCALCSMDVPQLLDAAHLIPVSEKGSYDSRNGLVLCANHHRASERGLVRIDPQTTEVHYRDEGPDKATLRVTVISLDHLPNKPHQDALQWLWNSWHGWSR